MLELDPAYCDVILRRYQWATGIDPCLAETGEPFSVVSRNRTNREQAA